MALDPSQFRRLLRETLALVGWYSDRVEELLFAISAHESHLGTYLWQIGGGPARGLFGMEPLTERDHWQNYLRYRPNHIAAITIASGVRGPTEWALTHNLAYQIVIARIDLLRDPEPLPKRSDLDGMARYWKKNWNSHKGLGTIEKFKKDYIRFNRR